MSSTRISQGCSSSMNPVRHEDRLDESRPRKKPRTESPTPPTTNILYDDIFFSVILFLPLRDNVSSRRVSKRFKCLCSTALKYLRRLDMQDFLDMKDVHARPFDFDPDWYMHWQLEKLAAEVLQHCRQLTHIDFHHYCDTNTVVELLDACKDLEYVNISAQDSGADDLKILDALQNLRSLRHVYLVHNESANRWLCPLNFLKSIARKLPQLVTFHIELNMFGNLGFFDDMKYLLTIKTLTDVKVASYITTEAISNTILKSLSGKVYPHVKKMVFTCGGLVSVETMTMLRKSFPNVAGDFQ